VTKNKINEDCKIQKVKYLTTYVNSRMWEVAGGNAKIDLKAAKEMANMESEKLMTANFFVPMIIKEIKSIFDDSEISDDEKLILIELSKVIGKIWNDSTYEISEGKSKNEICVKVNSILNKYHKLSEDDSHFYKMIFTMDDGPFYGFDTNKELEKLSETSFDQFKLIIRGNEIENTIELVEGNNMKWRKVIARSEDYKIKNLNLANEPVRVKNELGYKIALSGDGELIQLYLRKNGDFRLFFHSW
jgi:hypothetical protein